MNISSGTIARTIILALALINQLLTVMGLSPIPIEDESITEVISLVVTIGASLVAWWKNQSFSPEAIEADKYMRKLKSGR